MYCVFVSILCGPVGPFSVRPPLNVHKDLRPTLRAKLPHFHCSICRPTRLLLRHRPRPWISHSDVLQSSDAPNVSTVQRPVSVDWQVPRMCHRCK